MLFLVTSSSLETSDSSESFLTSAQDATIPTAHLPMLLRNSHLIHIFHIICKPPSLLPNKDIIPTHLSLPHNALFIVRPILQAIAPLPLHPVVSILILVPELHGDLVVREGEELLAQTVVLLLVPLGGQELDDLFAAFQEDVAVAPDRVLGVRKADLFGVPGER